MILEGDINQHGPIVRVTLRGPDGTEVSGDALIDTGARITIVDSVAAITKLRAPVVGHRQSLGACSSCELPQVELPMRVGTLPWELRLLACTPRGVLDKGGLLAALGWDILRQGRLTTDGPKRRWRFVTESAAPSLAAPRGPSLAGTPRGPSLAGTPRGPRRP